MCKVKRKTKKKRNLSKHSNCFLPGHRMEMDHFVTPSPNQIAHLCFYLPTFSNEIVTLHLFLFLFFSLFAFVYGFSLNFIVAFTHFILYPAQYFYNDISVSGVPISIPFIFIRKCIYNPIPSLLSWTYCRDIVADGNIVLGMKNDLIGKKAILKIPKGKMKQQTKWNVHFL